ncbi:DNA repair protein rad50 [Neophaeococcomyces mojaviensis]|uniref:DNA repair protein rad50 n=1 Tax=Neophaeococcomyces mojaviensis TaxID=3383035 RepID=A0ACC3ALA2_9EURO|nr:DNA repair protein rad50 [Knufia sp. JES_112]
MSTIDKMMIVGVRAFNPRRGETIKFEPPLTLVAGVNGSGKTTIIEALKFATTGIMPPGAKIGGAWIHDPGLEGERETMAQVKLGFHAPNGTRLVATRSLQLQAKKTQRSQKALEACLLMERHGQKTTLSTRVAELDQQVPNYLGVSTSLLENVIFCHQEESQWPLAESSVLKKKFDDIFEAGKYTKAVVELIKIRKKHKDDLGRQEEVANSAKKDRDRARKVKRRCEELHAEIEELRRQGIELQEKMNTAQQQANDAWKAAEEFADVLGKLEGYRIEANSKEQTIKDLKIHLKEASESDEFLGKTLAEFDNTLARYEQDRKEKKIQWLEYEDDLKANQDRLSEKLAERGSYEQAKREHERQLEDRKRQVKEGASKHQIRGFDDLSDDNKVEEFLFRIKKTLKDRETALDRAHKDADREKKEAQILINRLTEREAALKDNKIGAKRQIAINDHEAAKRQKDADQIDVDEGSKAVIESRIEELSSRLNSSRQSLNAADYANKIKQANTELSSIEDDLARLNNELIQGTKRAGEVAQLSHYKQDVKEKERSLQTLSQAHGSRISSIVGADWDANTLEAQYRNVASDAAKDVSAVERERDSIIRESEQVQFKQKSVREDLNSRKRQAQHHEDVVMKATGGNMSEYGEALNTAEYRLEAARDQAKGLEGLADWFNKALDTAMERSACRLCERAFKGPDDPALKRFHNKLQGLIKKASSEQGDEELKEATEDHKRIQDAQVNFENWNRLKNEEIPLLEQELSKLSQDHEKLLHRIESHDKKVESRRSVQKEVESISSTVASIVRTDSELKSSSAKVEELSAKQSQRGSIRTLEDIREEIGNANDKASEIKKTILRLTDEQEAVKSEIVAMEFELRDLKNDLGTVGRKLDLKQSHLSRVEEYNTQNEEQRKTINSLDADIEKIGPELATANAKYDDLDQRWADQIRDMGRESASLLETVQALDFVSKQIQAYEDEGGEARLTKVLRDIDRLRQEIGQLEKSMAQLTRDIGKVDKQLSDAENTRRHYSDNLRYRQETKSLEWLRAEIEDLDSKNAHLDRERLQKQSKRRTEEYHLYSGQREGVVGEMKSKDKQLEELVTEYNTDLRDAAIRYKEAHIKVETTKAAVEDIGRYSTALDQAITKYHALKMDEVNAIIDELWKKTYQGSDVDTIFIKSDLEVKANTRSHNYRVVMVKRDIELDMRGRCSAGQKVLASIIIRLALAECFSKDCGVIALDEPTTNLDEKNIQALAAALHEIINARRQQKNFQLIIITHDESFLREMQCADFTDYYYHISRDQDDHSIIEKQSILEIMR